MTLDCHNKRLVEKRRPLRWALCLGIAIYFLFLQNPTYTQLQWKLINSGSVNGDTFSLKHPSYPSSLSNNSTIMMKNIPHSKNLSDYSVVIIHYHKTGHELSVDLLQTLLSAGRALGLREVENLYSRTKWITSLKNRDTHDQLREELRWKRKPRPRSSYDDDDGPRRHHHHRSYADHDMDNFTHPRKRHEMLRQSHADDDNYAVKNKDSRSCTEQQPRHRRRKKRMPKRYHDPKTKCPVLSLELGKASIVAAPNFFCSIDTLGKILIPSQSQRRPSRYHDEEMRPNNTFYGTKIIHLIRDPFDMALSNYFYHAQVPTPETWVTHDCSPCDTTYYDLYSKPTNRTALDLMLPTLTTISQSQIDDVISLCQSIFQNPDNGPELIHAPFYNHLTNLEQYDALRLSTSRQIIGGGGKLAHAGQDILRMANNVVKLHQLINKSGEIISPSSSSSGTINDVQVLTMKLAQWSLDPYGSMVTALDFVFGESISQERKVSLATHYKDLYEMKASDSDRKHITSNKDVVREQKQKLLELLNADGVLGPVLRAVQNSLQLYA